MSITAEDNQQATKVMFRCVQKEGFREKKRSHLENLYPFIDAEGLIRARGRLITSEDLSFGQKHPIVLVSNHHVTLIVLRNEHLENHQIEIGQLRSMVQ